MTGSGVGSAPGKIILLGEHSVVFGQPAIAATIARRLEVHLAESAAPAVGDVKLRAALEAAADGLPVDASRLSIEIRSDVPPACGLGSSAALSLALVRALGSLTSVSLSKQEERSRASRVEDVFHGTASGLDVAASAADGVIWFERGEPPNPPRIEALRPKEPFDLVIALSSEPRSTAGPVGRLRERRTRRPGLFDRMFGLAGDIVRAGREAIESGDLESLGASMDCAQGLLNGFGVSTPTLERMIAIARGTGALGAKLSGAGGGGAIVALGGERTSAVIAAFDAAGFEAFPTRVGAVDLALGQNLSLSHEDVSYEAPAPSRGPAAERPR
jgi:mevalonate kinase